MDASRTTGCVVKGSGISPFIPVTTPSSSFATITSAFLFLFRLPIFLTYSAVYFLFLHHLPLPAVVRKLLLWTLLAIPGIWWVDLQLDGVKRGSLSQHPPSRVPHPRSVIAANFTSPIDALYLAAVFDPIFVAAHPHSRKVRRINLFSATSAALSGSAQFAEPLSNGDNGNGDGGITDLGALLARHPDRVIAVFPECATTNGKGILPFSPCLLTAPVETAIFPVSMRYTPPDITTPVPGAKAWMGFLWKLLGRSTHTIRVRIAEGVHNTTQASNGVSSSYDSQEALPRGGGAEPTAEEQRMLDRVAEALARLRGVKRVGLTVRDKKDFVAAWNKRRR
ncbi:putative lysophosphatidic acid:oleoyl-CoA acyltransferase [Madurella mycetomatis]|uniref:Lysophosphatidic acid:oleoyl-CoA acyltransferase n=1 Tax=Madurella mycetomatis TaxID=100816 RepID=A0A175WDB0_9PEZI|nr:putative lysophosphatidic acid:oleoyl-CoA acyltransferase [Madurella mycetomatis]